MVLDVVICIIVFISAVCYAHIGFIKSIISAVQWILCLACGLFFSDDIKDLLYKIGLGKGMEKSIAASLSEKTEESGVLDSIPGLFRDWAGTAADQAARETAASLTGLILTVFSFLALILAVKLVLFLITHLVSKEYHDGPIAFLDSCGGLVLGVVLGVFYVFIAMAVLVLVMHFLPDDTCDVVRDYLDTTYFSEILYDNNPLLMLMHISL